MAAPHGRPIVEPFAIRGPSVRRRVIDALEEEACAPVHWVWSCSQD